MSLVMELATRSENPDSWIKSLTYSWNVCTFLETLYKLLLFIELIQVLFVVLTNNMNLNVTVKEPHERGTRCWVFTVHWLHSVSSKVLRRSSCICSHREPRCPGVSPLSQLTGAALHAHHTWPRWALCHLASNYLAVRWPPLGLCLSLQPCCIHFHPSPQLSWFLTITLTLNICPK